VDVGTVEDQREPEERAAALLGRGQFGGPAGVGGGQREPDAFGSGLAGGGPGEQVPPLGQPIQLPVAIQ
jgi:hypothetical protein